MLYTIFVILRQIVISMSDLELKLKEIDKIANKIRTVTLRRFALLYRESIVLMPVFIEKFKNIVEIKKNYPPIKTIMETLDCSQRTAYDYYNMILFLDKARSVRTAVDQKMFTPAAKDEFVIETPQKEVSDDEFFSYVEQAYYTTKERSEAVPIPKIRNKLIEYTGLSRDEIDLRLYRLFLQHKVDLQPGGSDDPSEQLVSDTGYRFYWFKFRPEREEEKKEEKKHERTIEDRTGEWLQMTPSGIQYELEGYTVAQMKQAAARILKTGDRRIKNKQKMIERILKRMKEYRSRFDYGITSEEVIKQEYDILNKEYPALGGVIEIPALWERVHSRISIDRETFDKTLKKLSEQEIIDLKFAMDSMVVKDPEAGITHPKGLLYYVLYRPEKKKETQLDKIKKAFSSEVTEDDIKRAYLKVKQEETRFSDLIPFNYLKKELRGFDEEEIDQKLLELEKKRIVDLQVAYDASQVQEPEYGINLPGRGLIYFVRFR